MRSAPRWALPLVLLAFAVAALRAALLIGHVPLLALANSYDQARYSGCFDLYPDRPAYIRPDTNSPEAPFSTYAFRENPVPLCYLSTDLLPQGAAAALFRAQSLLGGQQGFDVRWLGALRAALLLGLGGAICRAWWRRALWPVALANAAVLALVLMDPANTLYFSTFYAESAALFVLYLLLNLVPLWQGEAPTARRAVWLAAVAAALSLSKIQHLALPLALGLALLLYTRWAARVPSWQGWAVLAGGLLGCLVQFAQLGRGDLMMASIRSYNRADVVFTALLPNVDDPAASLARLGLPARCIAFVGKPAWQLPGLAEDVCPGIGDVGRAGIVLELLRQPRAALRLGVAGAKAVNPWLAPNLGVVEGEIMGSLPQEFFTLSRLLQASSALRWALLALPFMALLSRWRRDDRWTVFCLLVAAVGPATLAVILLGDGLADTPKQSHLIVNADLGLAVAAVPLVLVAGWRVRRRGSALLAGGEAVG
jgi:hypothetical protein